MKKLYKIILLIIAVALFISCDEKKAKDEITKALDKTVEEKDKATSKPKGSGTLTNTKGEPGSTPQGSGALTNTRSEDAGGEGVEELGKTPPPSLTPPALSSYREKVGTPITFPKVPGYTYTLKQKVSGVILSDATSDATKKQVSSTKIVSDIIVVATKDGNNIESKPIEFFMELTKPVFFPGKSASWGAPITFPKVAEHTYELKEKKTGVALTEYNSERMQVTATQSAQNVIIVATFDGRTSESDPIEFERVPGNTLSFQYDPLVTARGTTLEQTATKSGTVAGDTRDITYSVSPTGAGITIDSSSGEVTVTSSATERGYTVTAELPETEKYTKATVSYRLVIE